MTAYNLAFCTLPQVVEGELYFNGFDEIAPGLYMVAGFTIEGGNVQGLCPMATVKTIEAGLAYLDSLVPPTEADLAYFDSL